MIVLLYHSHLRLCYHHLTHLISFRHICTCVMSINSAGHYCLLLKIKSDVKKNLSYLILDKRPYSAPHLIYVFIYLFNRNLPDTAPLQRVMHLAGLYRSGFYKKATDDLRERIVSGHRLVDGLSRISSLTSMIPRKSPSTIPSCKFQTIHPVTTKPMFCKKFHSKPTLTFTMQMSFTSARYLGQLLQENGSKGRLNPRRYREGVGTQADAWNMLLREHR